MSFQLSDITKLVPEIILLVVAFFVLLSDLFGRWKNTATEMEYRVKDSAVIVLIGVGVAFVIALLQSGFVFGEQSWASSIGFLANIRSGGDNAAILGGAFMIDPLTHVGRLVFLGALMITVIISMSARPHNSPGEFYALLLFSTLGMIIMTAAGELLMIYLGVELTSIPLYILAGYYRRSQTSTEAGLKYYIFGALSSSILLFGMSLVLGMSLMTTPQAGSEAMIPSALTSIAQAVTQAFQNPSDPGQAVLLLGLLFMLAGMAYKVAIVPFHSWSPDVYQGAPTTMTAFISTASKTAGFFLLYRVLLTGFSESGIAGTAAVIDPSGAVAFGGWTSAIALVAALTMLVGNLAALPQSNAKRLLAYSSIAQAGFLLLGLVGMGRDSGVALIYYLVAYTVTNLGAFGILALIEDQIGGTDLSDLRGLGQRAPGLALMLTIFVLSLAGIPPLSGFFAKFYVFIAAWQEGAKWLVIFAVSNTVVSLYYYLQILRAVYFGKPINSTPVRASMGATLTMTIAVALVVLFGLLLSPVYSVFEQAAVTLAAR